MGLAPDPELPSSVACLFVQDRPEGSYFPYPRPCLSTPTCSICCYSMYQSSGWGDLKAKVLA